MLRNNDSPLSSVELIHSHVSEQVSRESSEDIEAIVNHLGSSSFS
jgi:hypothetical protein